MKRMTSAALMAYAGLISMNAHAATTSAEFTVTINLTSACEITHTGDHINMSYTSFQTSAAATDTTTFDVRCTSGLPYKLSLSDTNDALTTQAYTDTTLALGYTLALTGDTGGTGNGADASFTVQGSMDADQVGNYTASGTHTNTHTLYVHY